MKNPINLSLKTEIWPLLTILVGIGLSIWAYPQLPEQVVTHWNFNGQPDDWSSRLLHSILFPSILVVSYILVTIMPSFDPRKERYGEFANVYLMVRNLIMVVLLGIFLASTLFNLGYNINIGLIVPTAIGGMMIIIGNYFGKLKRNSFIGIRTKWSLYSENTWYKTHRLGSRIFIIWGFLLIFIPWLEPTLGIIVFIGGLVMTLFGSLGASYYFYKQEKKHLN